MSDDTEDREVDRQVEELEESGERVGSDIEDAKRDWEAKQQDPGVPGAVEAAEDEDGEPSVAQSEHGEAADEAGQ